jgi:hypothetical protein
MHDRTALIKKSNLVEQVTSKYSKLVLSIIKEYIDKLCHEYLPKQASLLLRYITDVDNIDKLKELVLYLDLANSEIKDEFLCKFLKVFNFTISLEDLNSLQAVASNEKNKHSISALKAIAEDNKPAFDINMAIAIHSLFSLEYNEEAL